MASVAQGQSNRGFAISGWREAVVSVSDMRQQVQFFKQIAGWQIISRSRLQAEQIAHWQLPAHASGHQVLMHNPGSESGFIRLVQFEGVQQQQIRSNTQSWDTGGLFDLNVRVADMQQMFKQMQASGWQAATDPIQFKFGPFVVKEWLSRGADGLVLALIERLQPKLEGWPHLKKLSRAFNSTQTVHDMQASLHFYRDVLGFKLYLEHKGVSEAPGENVLGLPLNAAMHHEQTIYILHPEGINEGSVELISFDGIKGRDVSSLAAPPNLGLLMLRFPVTGLAALAEHLQNNQVNKIKLTPGLTMPPYGEVDLLSVQAPEGAWLEFFEEAR